MQELPLSKKNWQVAMDSQARIPSDLMSGASHLKTGVGVRALSHRFEPLFESPAIDNNPGASLVAVCDHLHIYFRSRRCVQPAQPPPVPTYVEPSRTV